MIFSFTRILFSPHASSCIRYTSRSITLRTSIVSPKNATDQVDYIKSAIENDNSDWSTIKSTVLDKNGTMNKKNVDAILLKVMINNKKFEAALSFANYLKKSTEELTLGSINGLLELYYEMGKENKLSDKEIFFILDTYKNLYKKYDVLDYTTCERLLHALCIIDEWKLALKLLEDIHLSGTPTHSAYSTLIATLFKNNNNNEAMKIIVRSLNNRRPLQHIAYEEWINYTLRKYKDKKTILKYLDEIISLISKNCVTITRATAEKLRQTYTDLGWNAHFTKIRKQSGQCMHCENTLDCLNLTDEEFHALQQNVKEKLIVGSDLFLKTSPDELKRFLKFIEETAPYDIVLDALNIAYAVNGFNKHRINFLTDVVNYFRQQNKKILFLGRKHMLSWPKKSMIYLMNRSCSFFTDDLSQDDPFFITAAILSGSHTDIVSKDLLRGHRFQMKDESLKLLFQRWQWQHQWMVFISNNRKPNLQPPLKFTPCAQKKDGWHLPYQSDETSISGQVHVAAPDFTSWLCLSPKIENK